jgi:HlyD family secretion protein
MISFAALLLLTSCGDKVNHFDATGTFEATEVTVSAKASGELVVFQVSEGQEIEKGKEVGHIDSYQLQLKKDQLATTRSQLDANKRQLAATRHATDSKQLDLEMQVAAIKQQIANAQVERQRFSELVNDGAVPRKQLDDINYQIKVLQKQLSAAQEQIKSNNASLAQQSSGIGAQMEGIDAQQANLTVQQAQLDDQIANTLIKSPIKGTVLEKYVEQGEFVSPGKPLFKMADISEMTLRAYVTSAQLEKVKLGQAVKVSTDYGDHHGQTYDGVVTWISSQSEFTPKTIVTDDERADLVYAVKVKVKNDGQIKMGMYGKLRFEQH